MLCIHTVCMKSMWCGVQKNRITWREIMYTPYTAIHSHTRTHVHRQTRIHIHTNSIKWKGIAVKRSRRMIAFKGHICIIRRFSFMYDAIKAAKQANMEQKWIVFKPFFMCIYKYYSLTFILCTNIHKLSKRSYWYRFHTPKRRSEKINKMK